MTSTICSGSASRPGLIRGPRATNTPRGWCVPTLPGRALVSGQGRADAQFAVDAAGELYILTKTDGVLRAVVEAIQE